MESSNLITVWKAARNKNTKIPSHSHNYSELVYYVSGNGKTTIGDTEFCFLANSISIIPPNTPHSEVHFADCEVICVGVEPGNEPEVMLLSDDNLQIHNVLKTILYEVSRQEHLYKQVLGIKLKELFLIIERLKENKNNTSKSFEYIINYLSENYHEKINLNSCAKQLNLSYDYFQHKFKKITGKSPRTYLLELRLDAAKTMLKQGEISCTQIAYSCGFSTSAQFSMLFKKAFGVTPNMYKKIGEK